MSKYFFDSTTIRAGYKVRKQSNIKATASVAIGAIAPILLNDLGVGQVATGAITEVVNGVVSGVAIESLLISTGISVATKLISKKRNEKLAEEIIKGRIKATEIDPQTIPDEYVE